MAGFTFFIAVLPGIAYIGLHLKHTAAETQLIKYVKRTGCSLPDIGIHHKQVYAVLHELAGKYYLATYFGNLIWLDKSGFKITNETPSKKVKRPEPLRFGTYILCADGSRPAHTRPVSDPGKLAIFERDYHVCYYCSYKGTAADLTVDHLHPKSKGGTNDPKNLVTCCLLCNRAKGDLPVDEFLGIISRSSGVNT